jgi:hypothetical protein
MQRGLGLPLIIGGSVALTGSLLLKWSNTFGDRTYWQIYSRDVHSLRAPVALSVVIAATLVLAAAAVRVPSQRLSLMSAAAGLIQFGFVLDEAVTFAPEPHNSAPGGYIAAVASLVTACGAVLVMRSAQAAPGVGIRAAEPRAVVDGPSSADRTGSPSPGWYPDPSGAHAERLWDGNGWTEQVRG